MAAATGSRFGQVAALGVASLIAAAVIGIAILGSLLGKDGCDAGSPPSKAAERDIPRDFLALYQRLGARYGLPWPILAGIGKEECDHGRLRHPACTPRPGQSGRGPANFAGAAGPMQIGISGAAGCMFCSVRVDGGGDGRIGTHDPADSIAMAARTLLEHKGARKNRPLTDYRSAVRAYNGAGPQAEAYATRVLADARAYASWDFATASSASGCDGPGLTGTGVRGKVVVAAGANRPGVQLRRTALDYLAAMAGLYGKPIIVSTGTNHDRLTVNGNVSDHWDGHAADLGMAINGGSDGSRVGDLLMTACLRVAGVPAARAAAQAARGGLYTLTRGALRIQCIWKTYAGGNHYTHVHVGVQPG
ncbi:MAG TPA: hypothetical protein VF517_03695 [Thermoleophilaceae bacterium]|jgi:hypothetical protein